MTVIIWKESRRRLADARQWACPAASPLLDAWDKAITEAAPGSWAWQPMEDEFLDHFDGGPSGWRTGCPECKGNARYWAAHKTTNPATWN